MKTFLFIIVCAISIAADSNKQDKRFSFQKKSPNTTPPLVNVLSPKAPRKYTESGMSLVLSRTTLKSKQENKLKRVREETTSQKFKKFLNSKSLSKNLFNSCWSNPCLNNAKCYGSVTSFKCKGRSRLFKNMLRYF